METVGRYEILRELGRGGMATVYLAQQVDLGRLVALKELGVLRATDGSLARRFLREARMAGALSHPNIVTVHDYFDHGGTPFIAMEYVDGGSLRSHVEAGRSLAQVGGVLEGLLAGLAHAERHSIVHRDLKPENVLVTSDGRVKIADFGIAKASDQLLTTASLTAAGTTMGTPAYMAPEQAMGQAVTPRTDLYAVGVIAFELLVGRTPFADTETAMAVLMRQVNDTIPPVRSLRPEIDPRVSDWIDGLLAKDPAERTASAEVARDDLDEVLLDLLGPRWHRDSRLPVVAEAAAAAELASPLGRRSELGTPRQDPLARRSQFSTPATRADPIATPPTRRAPPPAGLLADDRTLPPRASAAMGAAAAGAAGAGAASARPPRAGRRWPRAATALFALVAVGAALAALAVHGGSGGAGTEAPPATIAAATDSRAASARTLADQWDAAAQRVSDQHGNASTVSAMRQVAANYRTAATAADSGDTTGYSTALATAQSGAESLRQSTPTGTTPTQQQSPTQEGAGNDQSSGSSDRPAESESSGDTESSGEGENADDGGDEGSDSGGGSGENADDGGDGP
jgi:serine/threonine protein kinase